MRHFFLARPASSISDCVPRVPLEHRPVVPSGVPLCASAPPVKGYLRIGPGGRKRFFAVAASFFRMSLLFERLQAVTTSIFLPSGAFASPIARRGEQPETRLAPHFGLPSGLSPRLSRYGTGIASRPPTRTPDSMIGDSRESEKAPLSERLSRPHDGNHPALGTPDRPGRRRRRASKATMAPRYSKGSS
jgi:hypothetical protein